MDESSAEIDSGTESERLAVLRRESRDVLDHQIAVVRSIDEKAMWLVRTAVIVTSIVVSGAGIAGQGFLARNWAGVLFATFGIATLLFVSIWGSIVFAVSRIPFGPSRPLAKQLATASVGSEGTHRVLLDGYEEWIQAARREVEDNATAFTTLQVGFVAAVVFLGISGTLVATSAVTDVGQPVLSALGAGVAVGVGLYLRAEKDRVEL